MNDLPTREDMMATGSILAETGIKLTDFDAWQRIVDAYTQKTLMTRAEWTREPLERIGHVR